MAQSARAGEYTDFNSAEGYDYPNECPGYGTKHFDNEAPTMLKFWRMRYPFIAITPRSTLARSCSNW